MQVNKQSSIESGMLAINTHFLFYIAKAPHFYSDNIELTDHEDPFITPLANTVFQPIDWVTI